MIENVKWGDVLISERILTGDVSKPVTIKINKNSSNTNAIYFETTKGDYRYYIKTEYHHSISKDNLKTIRITKDTPATMNHKPI